MSIELNNIADVPQSGLNLSGDPSALRPGEYTYMLNGCLSDIKGKNPISRMYKGNRLITHLPAGFFPIGNTTIAQTDTCLALVNPATGDSEIGVFDGFKYKTIASSKKLGFRIDRQIQMVSDQDFNGGKTVIFVGEDYPIRYMDLNNPPMLSGELDVDALNVFRKYSYPRAQVTEVSNNGRMLAGSYYVSLQYSDENGNGLTSCTTPVGPFFIYRDSVTQPKAFVNGSPNREPTDKSLRIALSNLDQSFKYVNVVIVKSYEGIRSAVVAATIPTYQTSYLYTGVVDTERDMLLDAVLQPGVNYASAKTVALSNGSCLLGNLKGIAEFNFQPYISNIQVQWQVVKEKYVSAEDSYANPLKSAYELQYRRNEVYDLGIVIRWTNGSKSRVYPLIARKLNQTASGQNITLTKDEFDTPLNGGWDDAIVPDSNDIDQTTGAMPRRWQHGNTAFANGTDLTDPNGEGPAEYGEFGYYESTDRWPADPAVWGDNAGMPIRRFKMPDLRVAPLTDGRNGMRSEKEITSIYKLGVRFANIQEVFDSLPDSVKSEIEGYELVRADRRNNKSIIGSGIIFNMRYQNWRESSELGSLFGGIFENITRNPDDVRLYPNYPLNDLRKDELIKKVSIEGDNNDNLREANDRYRKDVFTFMSPDTAFQKNLLFSGKMLIHQEVYGIAKANTYYLNPYPDLQDKGNNDTRAAYQMLVTGYYNNWKSSQRGNSQRTIREAMYIPFNSQVSSGVVGQPIQNLTRESTVLLATSKPIDNPSTEDTTHAQLTDSDFNCTLNNDTKIRTASAWYVSLVSPIGNQYGSVFDPRYCFTNYDSFNIKNNIPVFGGDSYIAPYSIKRQFVFYQNAQAFMDLPDGEMGIDLKNSATIAATKYYYEAFRKKARADSATQCESGNAISKLPVIYTGIPVVFCESDYNVDLRGNGNAEWETFYPNLKDGSVLLKDWTGIKNIDKDNDYTLNASYSEVNDLYGYQNADPFYNPAKNEQTHFSTRVIFSLQGSPENRFNNLLSFLPLNYHDFPRDAGELNDIRDVGNYRCIFRFDHAFYLNRIYTAMATEEGKVLLGSGKLFETQPARLSRSDNGYSGTNEQWAFNNTPFGSFLTDASRGSAFIFGESLNDIAANDVDGWMMENMPFQLTRDIPSFPNTDNPANPEGIGFHSIYDTVDKLWILTKRDYELIDKTIAGEFTIQNGKLYRNGGTVSLSDKTVFKDRSWTFLYDPRRQKWVGWASFTPTHYFQLGKEYYSFADGAIWKHDNMKPRTYYGKRYPYIVEVVLKTAGTFITHNSSFVTRSFPIQDNELQGESMEETFNKAEIYNQHQHTGLSMLTVQDENKLHDLVRDPIITNFFIERFIRKLNQTWNVADLYDLVKNPAIPFFLPGWPQELNQENIDYKRDYKQAAPIRDLWSKHRYIYDREKDIQLYLYMIQEVAQMSIK